MLNNRIDKVNELLQQQLAEFFNREIEFSEDTLVTIIEVKTSSDLQKATVWLSVLPINRSGSALEAVKKNISDIRRQIKKKLFIKHVPYFEFKIDDTEERASEIERLIDDLKKK